ncbi:hypothetical protein SH1V18_35920 [Vallitalea longa]|uniref:Uncharacterized protein n=1 Tax=Vallitalea longa TaxID=2936439 RepID=A0A9W6DH21_9FIRM|nr:hypothetical protein SH1V18_35920 [Vallitalea longa]
MKIKRFILLMIIVCLVGCQKSNKEAIILEYNVDEKK